MQTRMEQDLEQRGVPRYRGGDYSQFDRKNGEYQDWRHQFIKRYGFPIITSMAVDAILGHGHRFVEIGAGMGYLAYELRRAGADVVATDSMTGGYDFGRPWVEVEELDGEQAVIKYMDRVMIMSWPCYNQDWAARVLARYPGQKFIYIGEGWGGCTGDTGFHKMLEGRQWKRVESVRIPVWEAIHDVLCVYRRKTLPRRRSLRWFAQSLAGR